MSSLPKHNDKSQEMQRFGEKLRALRMAHNLTLIELAYALGYSSHGYLSEIESGHKPPTASFALKVSRFFDVPMDILLKDELNLASPPTASTAL